MGNVESVHTYAQTNLQLYVQLDAAGWEEDDLALVARAYELALVACGSRSRSNGKPFLCHLVGTASIVASWGTGPAEVVCGLLHSAYSHGDFADGKPGMTDAKRAAVRQAVGEECERLVAEYAELPWKGRAAERWVATDPLTPGQWTAIRVRLANELEDHLDFGMRFSRKQKHGQPLPADHPHLVLAARLVGPAFAQELAAAIAANVAATIPDALVREDDRSIRLAS